MIPGSASSAFSRMALTASSNWSIDGLVYGFHRGLKESSKIAFSFLVLGYLLKAFLFFSLFFGSVLFLSYCYSTWQRSHKSRCGNAGKLLFHRRSVIESSLAYSPSLE